MFMQDVMEGARAAPGKRSGKPQRVAEPLPDYAGMSPEMLLKKIAKLEKQMYQHARDLEFEEAAQIRDQIDEMRRIGIGFADSKAG